jgi:ribonuclease HI
MRQLALGMIFGKYSKLPQIYTDASKDGELCGIGIFNSYTRERFSYKLDTETSITTAELIAIDHALCIIQQHKWHNSVIFTDSQSSCRIIQNALRSSKLPLMIYNIIKKAAEYKVILQWIPSHSKIKENEIADELAKSGLNETNVISNSIMLKDTYIIFFK